MKPLTKHILKESLVAIMAVGAVVLGLAVAAVTAHASDTDSVHKAKAEANVAEVTKNEEKKNDWQERKRKYIESLRAGSEKGKQALEKVLPKKETKEATVPDKK